MTFLIDAFNVMYKLPETEEHMHKGELIAARRGLLDLFRRLRKRRNKPLILHAFFDGKKKPGDETRRESAGDLFLYYSQDLSADHLIKQFIIKSPSPGELHVVSSDKDIMLFAKKHRCRPQSSEDFIAWTREILAPASDKKPEKEVNPRLSSGEVNEWLRLFRGGKK